MTRTSHGHAPLVLVVDDSLDGRELVVDILELSGFRTAEAADGEQALSQVRELRPDVVLMDLSLPLIDGWEATRRLKADAETAHIPIIALTAHALPNEARSAGEAGCDGFVTKPCSRAQLLEAIATITGESAERGTK